MPHRTQQQYMSGIDCWLTDDGQDEQQTRPRADGIEVVSIDDDRRLVVKKHYTEDGPRHRLELQRREVEHGVARWRRKRTIVDDCKENPLR